MKCSRVYKVAHCVHEMDYSSVVAEGIRLRMKSKGLKQSEIAASIGINQSSFSRLLSGKSIINLNQLEIIAEELNCNASDILAAAEAEQ